MRGHTPSFVGIRWSCCRAANMRETERTPECNSSSTCSEEGKGKLQKFENGAERHSKKVGNMSIVGSRGSAKRFERVGKARQQLRTQRFLARRSAHHPLWLFAICGMVHSSCRSRLLTRY